MTNLLNLRQRLGYTREEAARILGVHPTRLLQWEIEGCPREDWGSKAESLLLGARKSLVAAATKAVDRAQPNRCYICKGALAKNGYGTSWTVLNTGLGFSVPVHTKHPGCHAVLPLVGRPQPIHAIEHDE